MPGTPTSWPACPQGKTHVGEGEARVWEDFHVLLLSHYLLLGKELDEPSAVLPGKKKKPGRKTKMKIRVTSWRNRVGTLAVPSHSYVTLGTLLNSSGPRMLTSEVEMDPTTYVLPQKAAGCLQEIGKESQ